MTNLMINQSETAGSPEVVSLARDPAGLEELRKQVASIQETPANPHIIVVGIGLGTRPTRIGGQMDVIIIEYDKIRAANLPPTRCVKHSAVWTDEAKLLLSMEIGSTYKITKAVDNNSYVKWAVAELVEEAQPADTAV